MEIHNNMNLCLKYLNISSSKPKDISKRLLNCTIGRKFLNEGEMLRTASYGLVALNKVSIHRTTEKQSRGKHGLV